MDPRLTGHEIAALLHREVERVISLGIERSVAIEVVAQRHGTEPGMVAAFLLFGVPNSGKEA